MILAVPLALLVDKESGPRWWAEDRRKKNSISGGGEKKRRMVRLAVVYKTIVEFPRAKELRDRVLRQEYILERGIGISLLEVCSSRSVPCLAAAAAAARDAVYSRASDTVTLEINLAGAAHWCIGATSSIGYSCSAWHCTRGKRGKQKLDGRRGWNDLARIWAELVPAVWSVFIRWLHYLRNYMSSRAYSYATKTRLISHQSKGELWPWLLRIVEIFEKRSWVFEKCGLIGATVIASYLLLQGITVISQDCVAAASGCLRLGLCALRVSPVISLTLSYCYNVESDHLCWASD